MQGPSRCPSVTAQAKRHKSRAQSLTEAALTQHSCIGAKSLVPTRVAPTDPLHGGTGGLRLLLVSAREHWQRPAYAQDKLGTGAVLREGGREGSQEVFLGWGWVGRSRDVAVRRHARPCPQAARSVPAIVCPCPGEAPTASKVALGTAQARPPAFQRYVGLRSHPLTDSMSSPGLGCVCVQKSKGASLNSLLSRQGFPQRGHRS